jgi:GST-like protein
MGQIPVMVDPDGPGGKPLTLSQSGAILLYLAEKSGKLIPKDPYVHAKTFEWLFTACTDISVTSGAIFQLTTVAKEKVPSNIEHFENRLLRYFRVCDSHLKGKDYLVGELTVADVALFPVTNSRKPLIDKAGDLPHLTRWMGTMGARPAIQRALKAFA